MSNSIDIEFEKKFDRKNREVRAYYLEKLDTDKNLGIKIDELVQIVKERYNEWSLTKVAQYIVTENGDLEGLSSKTIYNSISNETKSLYGHTEKIRLPKPRTILHNNVIESAVETFPQHVTEESSSTNIEDGIVIPEENRDRTGETQINLTQKYDVKDVELEPTKEKEEDEPFAETQNYINKIKELETAEQLLREERHKVKDLTDQNEQHEKRYDQLAGKLRIFSEVKEIDLGFDEPIAFKILVNPASATNRVTSITPVDSDIIKKIKKWLGH